MSDKSIQRLTSFYDLEVYRNSYRSSLEVMTKIVPKLPKIEKNDLMIQISRSCKAIPRLIAEGYAKRHQKKGFQKYLDDAMAECNETIVSLSHCKDLYFKFIDQNLCNELIDIYDKTGRQIYKLAKSWNNFKKEV